MIAENRGRNVITPQGTILLRGNFGEGATFQIVPQNILANSQRYITASPSAELLCDEKRPEAMCKTPLTLLLKGFFVGNYKISANMSFGEGTPNLFAATAFIALPFKFIIALAGVIVIVYVLIRKFKNW